MGGAIRGINCGSNAAYHHPAVRKPVAVAVFRLSTAFIHNERHIQSQSGSANALFGIQLVERCGIFALVVHQW